MREKKGIDIKLEIESRGLTKRLIMSGEVERRVDSHSHGCQLE